MSRNSLHKVLLVVVVSLMGTWVCVAPAEAQSSGSQNPNSTPVLANRTQRVRRDNLTFDQFVARRRQLEQDLANHRQSLLERRAEIELWDAPAQQAFQAAFGTSDPTIRQQVLGHINRQLELNQRMTASNFQETPIQEPGQYAYVYPNRPSTIYLDDEYYASPAVGRNSRVGTLAHEMSHFNRIEGTDDHTYGYENSSALASDYANGDNPAVYGPRSPTPWTNADNVGYYVEGSFNSTATSSAPATRNESEAGQSSSQPQTSNGPQNSSQPANRDSASSNVGTSNAFRDEFRAEIDRQMNNFRTADEYNRQNPLNISTPNRTNPADTANQPEAPISRIAYDEYAPRNGYDAYGNREDSTRRQYDENGNRQDSTRRQYDENGNRPDSTRRQYDENGYREDSTRRQYDENGNRPDSTRRQYDENGNRPDSTRRQYDENGNREDSTRRQYDENGNRPDSTRRQYDENGYREDSTRRQYDENGNRPDSTRRQYDENGNRPDSTRRQYDENGNRPDSTRQRYEENNNGANSPTSNSNGPAVNRRAPGRTSGTASLRIGN